MKNKKKLKNLPPLKTDQEAERFVDEADLSQFDLSGFKSMNFELEKKDVNISIRFSQGQLRQVRAEAEKRNVPYQRFIRQLIQRGLTTLKAA